MTCSQHSARRRRKGRTAQWSFNLRRPRCTPLSSSSIAKMSRDNQGQWDAGLGTSQGLDEFGRCAFFERGKCASDTCRPQDSRVESLACSVHETDLLDRRTTLTEGMRIHLQSFAALQICRRRSCASACPTKLCFLLAWDLFVEIKIQKSHFKLCSKASSISGPSFKEDAVMERTARGSHRWVASFGIPHFGQASYCHMYAKINAKKKTCKFSQFSVRIQTLSNSEVCPWRFRSPGHCRDIQDPNVQLL